MRHKQANLLFTAEVKERTTLLDLLHEHKSEEDPWTALEMDDLKIPDQLMKRGETKVLLGQLERRFGPLSEEAMQRVRDCSAGQLSRIAHSILTAATLEEVAELRDSDMSSELLGCTYEL